MHLMLNESLQDYYCTQPKKVYNNAFKMSERVKDHEQRHGNDINFLLTL